MYTALLTSVVACVFMKIDRAAVEAEYVRLEAQLPHVGWISQGYVQDRGPGAGGPHYQWTRKVRGKTVSVALSREQFEALDQAIKNWRRAEHILNRMQQLTRQLIFGTLPDTRRRKPLSKKVLGLI
jgi:hypothetical protein